MMIVTFEGPDGAGKSSTMNLVSQLTGFPIYKTPNESFSKIRARFDAPGISTNTRFEFYAHALKVSVEEIQQLIAGGKEVVLVDRFLHSLGIYHEIMDPSKKYLSIAEKRGYPTPDLEFVLTAPTPVLNKRIELRYQGKSDSHIERKKDFIAQVNARYQSLDAPYIHHIDTSIKSIDEVAQECIAQIRLKQSQA